MKGFLSAWGETLISELSRISAKKQDLSTSAKEQLFSDWRRRRRGSRLLRSSLSPVTRVIASCQ